MDHARHLAETDQAESPIYSPDEADDIGEDELLVDLEPDESVTEEDE
ncbi:MAG TPA: hypothetical protein VHZ98_05105 [Galbitalea sp.]|jgi:hypothetical protein|nr:hypothetical protein [Galbitalea sp.]